MKLLIESLSLRPFVSKEGKNFVSVDMIINGEKVNTLQNKENTNWKAGQVIEGYKVVKEGKYTKLVKDENDLPRMQVQATGAVSNDAVIAELEKTNKLLFDILQVLEFQAKTKSSGFLNDGDL